MEQLANVPQSNKPVTPTAQDVTIQQIGNQLQYPFDYQTQRALDEYIGNVQAFPIGGIFISVDSTNPSSTLGYGTWTAFASGRTLVGFDSGQTEFDTVEETGGAKTHTLTTAEMPAHTHPNSKFQNLGGGANYGYAVGGFLETASTDSAGGGGSHNNLQPYIVVYFWKRTA